MIDLTKKENQAKKIQRIVEGYSADEKLVVRITHRGVEIGRGQPVPMLFFVSWARIHRDAIERELADTRSQLEL